MKIAKFFVALLCLVTCDTAPTNPLFIGAAPYNNLPLVKFHAGQYAAGNEITSGSGSGQASQKAQEISLVRSGPSQVLGIQFSYNWNVFEPTTLGTYTFSVLDTDYIGITGWASGTVCGSATYSTPRHLGIYIYGSNYFSADPTTVLPTYITNNPSTYGAGYDGTHGGYWATNGSGGSGTSATAAWWRPAVMTRAIALLTALGSHVLPDGCTVDTSPYVEAVWFPAETANTPVPATDSTYTDANAISAYLSLGAGAATALPHTQFAIPNNFPDDQTTAQSINANLVTNRTAASGPDTPTMTSNMTYGQYAWLGYGWNGSAWIANTGTNLIGSVPYIGMVQGTELGFVTQQTAAATFTFANGTLQMGEIWWTIMQNNEGNWIDGNWYGSAYANPGSWNASSSGGVLATIVNSSLTNTSCPSAYTGGCNTM